MLARAIHRHRHAVQLDLLRLPRTRLKLRELISVVVAAHPGTAVYHALTEGFSTTDHLLATLYEYQNGFQHRIARPGVTDTRPIKPPDIRDPKTRKIKFDSMTIEEYERRREARFGGA